MGVVTPTALVRCAAGAAAVALDRSRVSGVEHGDRLRPRPTADTPGTIRTRGEEVPVLALAHWLGGEPGPGGQVLMLDTSAGRVGLLVDRVGVLPRELAIAASPVGVGRAGRWVTGTVLADGETLAVIDPERLLGDDGSDVEHATNLPAKPAVGRWIGIGSDAGDGSRPTLVAVPSGMVVEVIDTPPVAAVPMAPEHVRGVIGWRGRALAVVDPFRWVGVAPPAESPRVAVVRAAGGRTVALRAGNSVKPFDPDAGVIPARRPVGHVEERVAGFFDTSEATLVAPNWPAFFAAVS